MGNLTTLKAEILSDGKIDSTEVAKLREILLADNKIDTEEADLLFDLNTSCSSSDNAPEWQSFFVDAISSYLLNDEHSPNVIDQVEANWLIAKIGEDGQIDKNEMALLNNLKSKATSMVPNLLEYISKRS